MSNFFKFKKCMIGALVMAGILGVGNSYADEKPSKPTVVSNLSESQVEAVNVFTKQNDQLNDLAFQERVLELEAKVKKLELEKLKSSKEIEDIKSGKTASSGQPQPGEINGLNGEFSVSNGMFGRALDMNENKGKKKNPIDYVQATKIYGLDDNLKATLYYKGSVVNASVGESIADGIRLLSITKGVIVVAKGKETRRLSLTTEALAYENSLEEKKSDEKMTQQQMPQMATPMGGQRF